MHHRIEKKNVKEKNVYSTLSQSSSCTYTVAKQMQSDPCAQVRLMENRFLGPISREIRIREVRIVEVLLYI